MEGVRLRVPGVVFPAPELFMGAPWSWKCPHVHRLHDKEHDFRLTQFRGGCSTQELCILSQKDLEGNEVEGVEQAFQSVL